MQCLKQGNNYSSQCSPEARKMIEDGKGYRCEDYSGGKPGLRNLEDILYDEIMELRNTHVATDICNLFDLNPIPFLNACRPNYGDEDEQDPSDIDDLVSAIKERTGNKNPQARWLATKENARKKYCEGQEPTEYNIPKNSIVLSDLGEDGALILFPED